MLWLNGLFHGLLFPDMRVMQVYVTGVLAFYWVRTRRFA